MKNDARFEERLRELEKKSLRRRLRLFPEAGGKIRVGGREVLNFSSNDYLDLARDRRVKDAARRALEEAGAGSAASRLLAGTLPIHEKLERKLSEVKGYEAALLFGSGFLANVGVIPALAGRGDFIAADRLVHASIIDGCLLSRARLERFRHNDPDDLARVLASAPEGARRLVVTESVFSMDGDLAPLPALSEVADRFGALLFVDEAHATGVFGPRGAGRVPEAGLQDKVAVCMGTLSKALGGYGGFVACSKALADWFVNRARSFIYSTAPPPAAVGAALGALEVLEAEPELGAELLRRARVFRNALAEAGLEVGSSESPIVPIIVKENGKALLLSERLVQDGILVVPVRPPTVPVGTARLRLSVTLAHEEKDLASAVEKIVRAVEKEAVK